MNQREAASEEKAIEIGRKKVKVEIEIDIVSCDECACVIRYYNVKQTNESTHGKIELKIFGDVGVGAKIHILNKYLLNHFNVF